jgi:hypothetical protein
VIAAALLLAGLAAAPAAAPLRCAGTGAPSLRDAAGNVTVARIGAERIARAEAFDRCMAALRAAPLAGGGTGSEALAKDPALRGRVERAVRRLVARGAVRLFADGGVRVEVELPFRGRVEDLLAPAPAGGA